MKEEKKNIDKATKDLLFNKELDVPAFLWDDISDRITEKKRKKRAMVIWLNAASWAILVSFGVGYFLNTGNNATTPNSIAETSNKHRHLQTTEQSSKTKITNRIQHNFTQNSSTNQQSKKTHIADIGTKKEKRINKTVQNAKKDISLLRKNEEAISEYSSIYNTKNETANQQKKQLRKEQKDAIVFKIDINGAGETANNLNLTSTSDSEIDNSKTAALQNNEFSKEDSISIQKALEELDALDKELIAYNSAVQNKNTFHNKWKFGGGYSGMSNIGNYSKTDNILNTNNESDLLYNDGNIIAPTETDKTPTSGKDANYQEYIKDVPGKTNTPVSQKNISTEEPSPFIYNAGINAEYAVGNRISFGSGMYIVKSISESSTQSYVEIPMLIKFFFIKKDKLQCSVNGGYVPGFGEHASHTANSTGMVNSFSSGIGLDYLLTQKIGVNVEPKFKYIITDYQPQIGIQTGLFYKFK